MRRSDLGFPLWFLQWIDFQNRRSLRETWLVFDSYPLRRTRRYSSKGGQWVDVTNLVRTNIEADRLLTALYHLFNSLGYTILDRGSQVTRTYRQCAQYE